MGTRHAFLGWAGSLALVVCLWTSGGSFAAAAAPIDVTVHQEVDDSNPCTAQPIHLVYDGILRVQEFDRHSVTHGSGTVTTSDGYSGSFNWLLMSQGGEITTTRLIDMEAGPGHQRLRFQLLSHMTVSNGVVRVDTFAISLRCLGKPLT
jgi:hypothetical protein